MRWTKTVTDRFKQLFYDPAEYRYAQIAEKLSQEFGITVNKNMVIGIGKRLNVATRNKKVPVRKREVRLEERVKIAKEERGRNRALDIAASKPPAPPVSPFKQRIIPGRGRYDIYKLKENACRWPFGDKPPFLFCGEVKSEGSSYCEAHRRVSCGRW